MRLGDVLSLVIDHRGRTPKKLGGSFSDSGVPVISADNVKNGSVVLNDSIRCISSEMHDIWMSEKLKARDILLTSEGPMGNTAYLDGEAGFCLGQRLFALRADDRIIDSRFLHYSLQSYPIQKQLWSRATGSTVKGIRQKELLKIELYLPPLEIQKKIAEILSIVDSIVILTRTAIELNEQLKNGLMQHLLTRGIGHTKFKKTKIGVIPESWEISVIGNVADVRGGKRLPKGHRYADGITQYPYLRVTDFVDGTINPDNLMFLKRNTYEKISRYTISINDVYISIAGTIGLVGTVPLELDGASLTENAAKICRIKPCLDPQFLKIYLESSIGQHEIRRNTMTTTQPKLALNRIRKITLILPSLPEQKQIVEILDTLDGLISRGGRARTLMEDVKKGLMQVLLIGTVRVKV